VAGTFFFQATGCVCRKPEHAVRAALVPVGHLGEIQRAQLLARLAHALDALAARYARAVAGLVPV
jgi:hypothetical protein